jgi:hypothetical protein
LYLTSWEEGDKGLEGKSSWKELKAKFQTFEMLRLGIPKKVMKIFLVRKGDPQNSMNTQGISWWMGGLITSQPIMTMNM